MLLEKIQNQITEEKNKISATRGKSLREIVNINVHNPSINNLTLPSEKKYVCFNAVQKWDINLQDVVTLYQYQNCSSKWGFAVFI